MLNAVKRLNSLKPFNVKQSFWNSCLLHNDVCTNVGIENLIDSSDRETHDIIAKEMQIIPNFLTDNEEKSLFQEVEKYLRKLRYEYDHWDDAIHGYRETERRQWNSANGLILERVKNIAFDNSSTTMSLVHVLDLEKSGYIKPHIDSIRFCGDTIAGLSLLSPSVMRLVNEKDKTKFADCLLDRKSLYIMKGSARYKFTHEILKQAESKFKGETVVKDRRISVICRSEPES